MIDIIVLTSAFKTTRNSNPRAVYNALCDAVGKLSIKDNAGNEMLSKEFILGLMEKYTNAGLSTAQAYRAVLNEFSPHFYSIVIPEELGPHQPQVPAKDGLGYESIGAHIAQLATIEELEELIRTERTISGEWVILSRLLGAYDVNRELPELGIIDWAYLLDSAGFGWRECLVSLIRGCYR